MIEVWWIWAIDLRLRKWARPKTIDARLKTKRQWRETWREGDREICRERKREREGERDREGD
jgi:hypothetical protein